MEKEIDKKNLVLKEDESIGTVQIADDVVAMIASLAATEVDGDVYKRQGQHFRNAADRPADNGKTGWERSAPKYTCLLYTSRCV